MMRTAQKQISEIDGAAFSADAADQYLTFMLAEEEYGIEILKVQEIMGWEDATPIPNTPAYVSGVVNIRGEIVPVIDLSMRLGLPAIGRTSATVVVVVKMSCEDQERTVGLTVDSVSDVYHLDPTQIQVTPDLGKAACAEQVRGLATVGEKIVLILDVDRLIDFGDIETPFDTNSEKNDLQSEIEK